MNELKDSLILAFVVVGLVVLVFAKTWEPEGFSILKVTHIYEDDCLDVYDTEMNEFKFYCETDFK